MNKSLLLTALLSFTLPLAAEPAHKEASKNQQTRYAAGVVHHINSEEEFNTIIQQGNVVIDFYADWCNPCRRLAPILEKLAAEFPDILFFKVNFDTARGLSDRYKVRGIPTLIFFKNNQKMDQLAGLLSKSEYTNILNRVFPK